MKTHAFRGSDALLGLTTIVVLLLALEGAVRAGKVNAAIVPPPTVVVQKLMDIVTGGAFLEPLGKTMYLLFVSYAIGCALAVGVGLLMGRYRFVDGLLEPIVEFLRPLPKPALLPPLMLFLGLGDAMKMTVISLGVFFPVLINTVQGVRGTDPVLLDVGRTFGHKPTAALRKIILPSALPLILAGMRVSLGLGLVLVIVAEMMAGTGGIGFLVIDMQRSFRSADMYAWIVILAVLGLLLNALFVRLERRLIHWSYSRAD
ncbi:ABC transporter permease [Ramlibacter henchirensis]|uniref:ABC transporter permease n=1 Tax=Ramlibacter henchirensis TaxID=204072 RepID=A0A4Z0BTK4_9BURK|nr:ABC transporter permease [Ramlibacter henchirensis]TFZ02603.1 ABC transporter permease [Ramlibacter henchirensis]